MGLHHGARKSRYVTRMILSGLRIEDLRVSPPCKVEAVIAETIEEIHVEDGALKVLSWIRHTSRTGIDSPSQRRLGRDSLALIVSCRRDVQTAVGCLPSLFGSCNLRSTTGAA